jgi:hypothetical protein
MVWWWWYATIPPYHHHLEQTSFWCLVQYSGNDVMSILQSVPLYEKLLDMSTPVSVETVVTLYNSHSYLMNYHRTEE